LSVEIEGPPAREMIHRAVYYGYLEGMRAFKLAKNWYYTDRNYKSNTDPFQIYWLKPEQITYALQDENALHSYKSHVSEIIDGDWDTKVVKFRSLDVYQAFEARVNRGVSWEETEFYNRVIDEIQHGNTKWGCTTESQFNERCKALDKLYEYISTTGYQSQRAIRRRYFHPRIKDMTVFKPALGEITVNISRDGQFIFVDGRHRLSIAKLAGVDSIPIQIKARHKKWQMIREEIARGDRRFGPHPDLVQV